MEKVIIFGVGAQLMKAKLRAEYLSDMEIIAYSDNNKSEWGKKIDNIEVIPPMCMSEKKYDCIYITSEKYFEEIKNGLINTYHVPHEKIKKYMMETNKYDGELGFWKKVFVDNGGHFDNQDYKQKMLNIIDEPNDDFWKDKVVVDFGCGPCGSLKWTSTPKVKIGVDVLSLRYLEEFGEEMLTHDMIYVACNEKFIPLPANCADYVLTINSLDHVNDLESMTQEILRILKPEGMLFGSFNLNEPSSECEPQCLTENLLQEKLLCHLDVLGYKTMYFEGDKNNRENPDRLLIKARKRIEY